MKVISTKKLVLTALFMALTFVATMFFRVPLAIGYINLGDAFVFLSVFVLGPIYGTLAAGFGSAFADLFGYVTYAPGTLIIKSVMALLAYFLQKALFKATKKAVVAEAFGGVVGAFAMAFGYFWYETLFFEAVAIVNVPWNIVQGIIGVVLSVTVMRILSATKVLGKLQN